MAPLPEPPPEPERKSSLAPWLWGSVVLLGLSAVCMAVRPGKQGGGGASMQLAQASSCDGPCRPLSTPFKESLRFGMTLEEARAARKDVALATASRADEVPALEYNLGAERVCLSSDVVGQDGHCCLDFLPASGLGRLVCGSTAGITQGELAAMVLKVERVYGRAPNGPPKRTYDFEPLPEPEWQQDGHRLVVDFEGVFSWPGTSDDMVRNAMNPPQRFVMTQTSAAWEADLASIAAAAKRRGDEARAAAERERQEELERAREERKKLGLPPDPL